MRLWCAALIVVLSLVAAPFVGEAQAPGKTARIGVLSPFSSSDTAAWHRALRQGLHDLGWVEGRNLTIEVRHADGQNARLAALAADLVRLKVDVIVTAVGPDTIAAKNATTTIPIVMASAGDPVGTGLVASLARPGGNITGLTQISSDLAGKRLQLLKEIVPGLARAAVLVELERDAGARTRDGYPPPTVRSAHVRGARAFDDVTRARVDGVVILPGPLFLTNLKRIADFAVRSRLASIFHLTTYVDAGGLVAYGPDRADLFRRAAGYVDRILKGAKPADLPVEQASKFELWINRKTAKALGLTIPQSVLLRADRVIE